MFLQVCRRVPKKSLQAFSPPSSFSSSIIEHKNAICFDESSVPLSKGLKSFTAFGQEVSCFIKVRVTITDDESGVYVHKCLDHVSEDQTKGSQHAGRDLQGGPYMILGGPKMTVKWQLKDF